MTGPTTINDATIVVSADGTNLLYNGATYWVPGNTFTTNPDGSLSFNGTVWWPNGTNTATGTGVVIFGLGGAQAAFQGLVAGPPGVTPTIQFSMVQVAFGTTLPATNPAVTVTATDTNGVATAYQVVFYVNAGQPGANGTANITGTLGGVTAAQGYQIGWDVTNNTAKWQPIPVANWYNASGFTASALNTTSQKLIGTIQVSGQFAKWWPEIKAQAVVIGAVDTQINLVARIGNSTGQICGYGYGAAGSNPAPITAIPFGLGVGSPNIINASGSPTNIYLYAENQTSSANAWGTTSSAIFEVRPSFVPSSL